MPIISILPAFVDFKMVQKTDNLLEFVLETNGGADDITNDTVTLLIKTNYGGVQKVSKSNAPGQHSDPANGKTRFQLLRTELVGAPDTVTNNWVYELRRIVGGTNDQIVYMVGNIELMPAL